MEDALGAGLDRLDQRRRQVDGEGRLQALVGDHLQLALLARPAQHPLHEVAALGGVALRPVEAGARARPGAASP